MYVVVYSLALFLLVCWEFNANSPYWSTYYLKKKLIVSKPMWPNFIVYEMNISVRPCVNLTSMDLVQSQVGYIRHVRQYEHLFAM